MDLLAKNVVVVVVECWSCFKSLMRSKGAMMVRDVAPDKAPATAERHGGNDEDDDIEEEEEEDSLVVVVMVVAVGMECENKVVP